MSDKHNVICLMGPTASGKSGVAIALASRLPIEIISVDSALIYRGMDIGTAKPTIEEQKIAPHRMIDICDPRETYDVGRFCNDVVKEITQVIENKNVPLLVGGTMMYFHALQQGIADLPNADPIVREEIAKEAAELGWHALHSQLQKVDPQAAANIHPNDRQRIGRALEVYRSTGLRISELQQDNTLKTEYNFINIGILPSDRQALHQRIESRFDVMLKQGFEEEVRALYQRGDLNIDLPSMRTVGYRQMWRYLQGEYDLETMRERAIIATRQLAKRQFTWLRRWPDLYVVDQPPQAEQYILNLFKEKMNLA